MIKTTDTRPRQTVVHTTWCDPVEHARYADDMEGTDREGYCLSRDLVVTMADGREAGCWWGSPNGLPVLLLDQPFGGEFTPDGARTMLATLDGATNPLADALRALLTLALAELETPDQA